MRLRIPISQYMVLLHTENSKNDRLYVNVLHSYITFSLSFKLFSMSNNTVQPLTR